MDLASWKNCLKNLKFQITFASLPIQPTIFSQAGLPHLNSLGTKNFPRGQKNDNILSFLLILNILIGTLGSDQRSAY